MAIVIRLYKLGVAGRARREVGEEGVGGGEGYPSRKLASSHLHCMIDRLQITETPQRVARQHEG